MDQLIGENNKFQLKKSLRHSLGRPSCSDFIQFEFAIALHYILDIDVTSSDKLVLRGVIKNGNC